MTNYWKPFRFWPWYKLPCACYFWFVTFASSLLYTF